MRRPQIRDHVVIDDREYVITAIAHAPELGFWLGREDGPVVCERFVGAYDWRLQWDRTAKRWEKGSA